MREDMRIKRLIFDGRKGRDLGNQIQITEKKQPDQKQYVSEHSIPSVT